jgi:hypothetical protein
MIYVLDRLPAVGASGMSTVGIVFVSQLIGGVVLPIVATFLMLVLCADDFMRPARQSWVEQSGMVVARPHPTSLSSYLALPLLTPPPHPTVIPPQPLSPPHPHFTSPSLLTPPCFTLHSTHTHSLSLSHHPTLVSHVQVWSSHARWLCTWPASCY